MLSMKIRLLEIELGADDMAQSKTFYNTVLGLETLIDQKELNVFHSGITGLDFNVSNHLAAGTVQISFWTDDLQAIMDRLSAAHIEFSGPEESHLGMRAIEFIDPAGHRIKVHQPGKDSPDWLQVKR